MAKNKPGRPVNLLPPFHASPEAQKINKWFIKKLLEHTSDEMDIMQRIDLVFLSRQRRVVCAYLTKTIEAMPGLVYSDGELRDPFTEELKRFKRGAPLFIRLDATMPNRIDVEHGEITDLIFCLTSAEYKSIILPHLKEVGGCQDLLELETLSLDLV